MTGSLRVLHVLDHSLPLHSGYTFRTLALLREQRRRGWETFHLTTPKQGPGLALEQEAEGWHFYRTPNQAGSSHLRQMYWVAQRIGGLIDVLRPDLIHAHSPVLNALPALWVRHRTDVPLVYEMRASWEDAAVDHGSTSEGSLRYRVSRGLESFALRRADAVTTICEGLRQDILMRGLAEGSVTVIPNAVDVESFQFGVEADPALRQELRLDGCTVLGFAGSFYRYEGLHLVIDALATLRQRHPELRLLLVGGGPEEANLKAQVARLGLQEVVCFTGRVPHAQVQRYYELIDLLCYARLPIRLTELVTPLKPLEAMAQGRVLLASDVGGHRELIRDGRTGYLCPAGSAEAWVQGVERALADQQRWTQIRQQGRTFVETERTWANSVARYPAVYRQALARRGRRHPQLEG